MSLSKHLEEAVTRLEDANRAIEAARERPPALEALRDWLEALTAHCRALADVHRFTNESVHEKLHEIAGRVGLRDKI